MSHERLGKLNLSITKTTSIHSATTYFSHLLLPTWDTCKVDFEFLEERLHSMRRYTMSNTFTYLQNEIKNIKKELIEVTPIINNIITMNLIEIELQSTKPFSEIWKLFWNVDRIRIEVVIFFSN